MFTLFKPTPSVQMHRESDSILWDVPFCVPPSVAREVTVRLHVSQFDALAKVCESEDDVFQFEVADILAALANRFVREGGAA